MKKKERKFLKSLGFKKKTFDDTSGCWYRLKLKDKYLKGLRVFVEQFQGNIMIEVHCKDTEGFFSTLVEEKYSRKNLLKIIDYFRAV